MLQRCRKILLLSTSVQSRCASQLSKQEARKLRSDLFSKEKKRQISELGRIEKIEVTLKTPTQDVVLMMNKDVSTPYDCAKHVNETLTKESALALVNKQVHDMQRPLTQDCELLLYSMKEPIIPAVNTVFWRSCSFVLGAVAEEAFKDTVEVDLHSFTTPNIRSGSFVYDVHLGGLTNWSPTTAELKSLSATFMNITSEKLPFERLTVREDVALEIFTGNPFKSKAIPNIAANNEGDVTIYRIGEHVDISKGPMISHTGIIGRSTVSAVHKITSDDCENLYRFQGVALPAGQIVNHFAYGILESRARKLNETHYIPHRLDDWEPTAAVASN